MNSYLYIGVVYVQCFNVFAEKVIIMKKFYVFLFFAVFFLIFSSCSSLKPEIHVAEQPSQPPASGQPAFEPSASEQPVSVPSVSVPPASIPPAYIPPAPTPSVSELPPVPSASIVPVDMVNFMPSERIMGRGKVDSVKMANFLIYYNPRIDPDYVQMLADYYVEEAAAEGVNHDVAFSQMCHETGFLVFGGLVTADMNNFCGLGSTGFAGADGLPERGLSFPNPQTGIRAHIQHLKAYGSEEPLNKHIVDPRFRYVRRGRSPTIEGLAGTWASDPDYAKKIRGIILRLYDFAFN
jgi:hypothetical protein